MIAIMTSGRQTEHRQLFNTQKLEHSASFTTYLNMEGTFHPKIINIWRIALTAACHAVTMNADIRQLGIYRLESYCTSHKKKIFEA